ncbi:MAG: glycosyltransferase, partial [Chthoniobacterales bacterium]|nr:glycosyltransferase [Chthoniobacterales bacterium]
MRNLRVFAPPLRSDSSAKVSILIPARDEEMNIEAAVLAALGNANAEVLVLDDDSTDRTREMVDAIARCEPRLRMLSSEPLPTGWIGKNHACAQLAAAASHSLMLFVDADVRLAPDAAARLAASLRKSNAALISGVPQQEVGTFSEKLLVPLIHFLLLGFLPLERMRRSAHPAYASACGQLIMVERVAYGRSGGHSAIRGRVHDGLALPKQFRLSGFHTDLVDVTDLATCRMYRRNADVWRGLAKNTHEGLGAPARIVPMTLLLVCGQVLPFALLATGRWTFIIAAVLALLPRVLALRRFHQTLPSVVLHPIAIAALLCIQWAGLI